jgi:hypothetical protein
MDGGRSSLHTGRTMVRNIGRCIYCGVGLDEAKLTDEHIVPFALSSDSYQECLVRSLPEDHDTLRAPSREKCLW